MKKGFTLIELLVVIGVIGVLTTIVLAALSEAKERAKIAKARQEMDQIVKAITIAQGETGNYLKAITANNCSDCAGRVSQVDYRKTLDTDPFYLNWSRAISRIEIATNGLMTGVSRIKRDPWGSPYALDENEGEWGGCTPDSLLSYGPDGMRNTSDDIASKKVPFSKCP